MIKAASQIVDLLNPGATIDDPEQAIASEDRTAPSDRPWIYSNMIQSADGATAIDGLSSALGGPADLAVFLALRACADLILVGATTAAGEGYQPPNPSASVRSARLARGQTEQPTIAVITGSLSIEHSAPLFSDPDYRPLIITGSQAPPNKLERLAQVADVLIAGDSHVSLPLAVTQLGQAGHRRLLLEGGPRLNGQFIADGLVDEWNVTIAPMIVGGESRRAAVGSNSMPTDLTLDRLWSADGLLLCRYLRR